MILLLAQISDSKHPAFETSYSVIFHVSSVFCSKTNSSLLWDYVIFAGDIGYFDADGFLYIVDRVKDVMFYNGSCVSIHIPHCKK